MATIIDDLDLARALTDLKSAIGENRDLLNSLVEDLGVITDEIECLRQGQRAHGTALAALDSYIRGRSASVPKRSPLPVMASER